MRKKLNADEIQALVADYKAWHSDPKADGRTAHEVAASHGVSKQTMYTHVEQRLRRGRTDREFIELQTKLVEAQAQLAEALEALVYTTRELAIAKTALSSRRTRKKPPGK